MSAYLKFFELEQSPFEGKAQAQVVLGTRALREAFATIRDGLEEDAARICLNGGRGMGKTSLARALPKLLADSARVAVVLDPSLSWDSLRGSIAKQWGLEGGGLPRAGLVEAARTRRLVLVIDQAERASEEFLDYLDVLLSYRSENDEPVVQSVLLARLHGDGARDPVPLIWWLDRIQTLQLEFTPLPRDGVESYLRRHLKRAGWRGGELFSAAAARAIHGYTGGIPGEISALGERLLVRAAEHHVIHIDDEFVHAFFDEEMLGEEDARKAGEGAEPGDADELVLEDELEDPTRTLDDVEHDAFERGVDDDEIEGESDAEPFEAEAADLVGSAAECDGTRRARRRRPLLDRARPLAPGLAGGAACDPRERIRPACADDRRRGAGRAGRRAAAGLVHGALAAVRNAFGAPREPGHPGFVFESELRHAANLDATSARSRPASRRRICARSRSHARPRARDDPGRRERCPRESRTQTPPARIQSADDDDEIPDGELIDLRPAGLIPPSPSPAAPGDGA